MTDLEVYNIVAEEISQKNWEVTKQYLEIHSPIYNEGKIVISRIDREMPDFIIAYLPVQEEDLYFAVYIDPLKKAITYITTEAGNKVFLLAISTTLPLDKLQRMELLNPIKLWNKGDANKRYSYKKYEDSGIKYEPNPEPDEVEDKLRNLLNFLEQLEYPSCILMGNPSYHIQCFIDYHNGNQLLGTFCLDKSIMKRIAALDLDIEFNIAAWGKRLR